MRGRWLLLSLLIMLSPLVALAQEGASISGVVKDAQGSVVPGVTVEAASPVLIEKVRTSVTDGTGRYVIPDLRPGTYTITFTLTGFATVRREGIQLTGTGVTTVDADMRVGAVTETITVSGETPIVDVQTVRRQTVLDQEVVTAIPTSRNSFAVSVLIPGVSLAFSGTLGSPNNAQDVGGSLGPSTESLSAHGSRLQDQRQAVNGVALSTMIGGGWGGGAVPNATGTSEFAIDTAAVDAALATGGPRVNFIPKDGGNRYSGTLYGSYATESFQSETSVTKENFPAIRANTIDKNGDFNPGFGGPIVKDKVWFFGAFRRAHYDKPIANTFVLPSNLSPTAGFAACKAGAISCDQGISDEKMDNPVARITWQISPRNKFAAYMDRAMRLRGHAMGSLTDPATGSVVWHTPTFSTGSAKWTSTVSSKLLVEAGFSYNRERYDNVYQDGLSKPYGSAAWYAGARHNDTAQGTLWNASSAQLGNYPDKYNAMTAVSYVTGSHNVKVGFQDAWGP